MKNESIYLIIGLILVVGIIGYNQGWFEDLGMFSIVPEGMVCCESQLVIPDSKPSFNWSTSETCSNYINGTPIVGANKKIVENYFCEPCPAISPPYCPNGTLISQGVDIRGCNQPSICKMSCITNANCGNKQQCVEGFCEPIAVCLGFSEVWKLENNQCAMILSGCDYGNPVDGITIFSTEQECKSKIIITTSTTTQNQTSTSQQTQVSSQTTTQSTDYQKYTFYAVIISIIGGLGYLIFGKK